MFDAEVAQFGEKRYFTNGKNLNISQYFLEKYEEQERSFTVF